MCYFLFFSATSSDAIPVQTFFSTSGSNASISCPEMRTALDTFKVLSLEWYCRGCSASDVDGYGSTSNARDLDLGSSMHHMESKLVSYNKDGTVILRSPDRMYLSSSNFSLQMTPVLTADSGEYFCLVNDQRQPTMITRILVQGKKCQVQTGCG
jgi:hypothetical protein